MQPSMIRDRIERHPLRLLIAMALPMLVLILWVASASGQPEGSSVAESTQQRWEGSIDLPGQKIAFLVTFTRSSETEKWQATIDIPVQGVAGLALQDVTCTEGELAFTIAPPANAQFAATIDADDSMTARGQLKQIGMEFPIELKRVPEGAEPSIGGYNRPQTPRPPFPYEVREVEFRNDKAGITIAGTLTLPAGDGPYSAVVMITGSGAQDRDESIMGHKPFAVIADHLTRHGIAVLRCDDRGVGGTGGSIGDSTSADFADDALAGLDFISKLPEIDASKIGLVGHSEGGIVAPIAAAESDRVAFIVLLAGTGVTGREVLIQQLRDILQANGVAPAMIEKQSAAQKHFLDVVEDQSTSDQEVADALRALTIVQTAPLYADNPDGIPEQLKETIDAAVEAAAPQYRNAWFRYFLTHDPKKTMRNVHCPVLAVNGELDMQVTPEVNLTAIRQALDDADNKHFTTHIFPGLNHLFQPCTTGSPAEYASIEQTFDEGALELITNWIHDTVNSLDQ